MSFIKNFRRGFATNSSSSHSFVYLKTPIEGHDAQTRPNRHEYFGWNDFKLDTLVDKLWYVLVSRMGGYWNWYEEQGKGHAEISYETLKDEFPELVYEDFVDATYSYVDHQSLGTITTEQARDPHVVVFGGNDNGGESSERAYVVRQGDIDWMRTEPRWEDEEANALPQWMVQRCPDCDIAFYDKQYHAMSSMCSHEVCEACGFRAVHVPECENA